MQRSPRRLLLQNPARRMAATVAIPLITCGGRSEPAGWLAHLAADDRVVDMNDGLLLSRPGPPRPPSIPSASASLSRRRDAVPSSGTANTCWGASASGLTPSGEVNTGDPPPELGGDDEDEPRRLPPGGAVRRLAGTVNSAGDELAEAAPA
eukprot:COSAG01_NODE_10115_length_2247_cov_3.481844_3_plen_151_part_00